MFTNGAFKNPFADFDFTKVAADFKMPAVNVSLMDGQLAWRQHDGGHTDDRAQGATERSYRTVSEQVRRELIEPLVIGKMAVACRAKEARPHLRRLGRLQGAWVAGDGEGLEEETDPVPPRLHEGL